MLYNTYILLKRPVQTIKVTSKAKKTTFNRDIPFQQAKSNAAEKPRPTEKSLLAKMLYLKP